MFWGDDEGERIVGVDGTVEIREGGLRAELGESVVHLLVLKDEDALKEPEAPRDGGAVLVAGERGELMSGEVREVAVNLAQEIRDRERWLQLGADGEVINKGTGDAVCAGEVSRAAGEGGAVDDILTAGGVAEEGGPGGLGEDAGREAETAGGGGDGSGGFSR